jgi:predicted nucleic acid-binding protein
LIYLDSSVLLARLFVEDRCPRDAFWEQSFVSSRLLEYEVVNRVHARNFGTSYLFAARHMIDRIDLLDLTAAILARALEAFPVPPRTLDALHLATMVFLRANGQNLRVASYDARMIAAASALGFAAVDLG